MTDLGCSLFFRSATGPDPRTGSLCHEYRIDKTSAIMPPELLKRESGLQPQSATQVLYSSKLSSLFHSNYEPEITEPIAGEQSGF